jgi:hypothetical protein
MANIKISELTALTPPAAADELPVVDVSASSTKKTTVGEIVGIINGDVEVASNGTATISELPVSKLQDGAARQLLQTDAAGTGVEWTSNVDVPGTLDVTGAATFDAAVTIDGDLTVNGLDVTGAATFDAAVTIDGDLTVNGLDVTGAATFDAAVTIDGDLTVNGTTTSINTQNLVVEDKNIILGDVATPTDTTADGGGITLKGATDKTINWVDATDAWTSSERFSIPLGSAGLPSLTINGDANSGLYSPGADQVSVATGGTERLRIDGSGGFQFKGAGTAGVTQAVSLNGSAPVNSLVIDSFGRLLVGTSSARTNTQPIGSAGVTFNLQHEATSASAGLLLVRNSDDAGGPYLTLSKTRGTSVASNTVVASGDTTGVISFLGADGTNLIPTTTILSQVDGIPGTGDMPGRLVFSTTADGASSPTERLRITNDGVKAYDQTAPAAVNATATLTVANLKTGIITSTSAAATDMTLPTGTDTEAGFSGVYTNMTFEWSVINTGPSLVRVLAGTAHTIVGSGSVATGTSGRFASRRTAANTFVTYRLS